MKRYQIYTLLLLFIFPAITYAQQRATYKVVYKPLVNEQSAKNDYKDSKLQQHDSCIWLVTANEKYCTRTVAGKYPGFLPANFLRAELTDNSLTSFADTGKIEIHYNQADCCSRPQYTNNKKRILGYECEEVKFTTGDAQWITAWVCPVLSPRLNMFSFQPAFLTGAVLECSIRRTWQIQEITATSISR